MAGNMAGVARPMRTVLSWFGERARRRRPLLFAVLLGLVLLWPLAHRVVDVTASPEAALQDRAAEIIRAIQQGQDLYRSVHGYYDRLECVIQDSCAAINPYPPTYLDARLAWPSRFGYRFRFHDGPRAISSRDGTLSPTALVAYAMTAVPLDGGAGLPAFCGDDRGTLYRLDRGQVPIVDDGRCVTTGATVVGN